MCGIESSNLPRSLRTLAAALLILAAGALAYSNSFSAPFVYDDFEAVVNNESIRQLWPLEKALWAPAHTATAGRPVVNYSLALNYAVGELRVAGYRAFNLAVHLLCALALFGIVRRTLLSPVLRERLGRHARGVGLAAALLWVVHPMTTESVTYISTRTESVMAMWFLLTMYASIRAHDSRRRGTWIALAGICCVLGMASKESMATAPLVVFLWDFTYSGRSVRELLRRRWPLYAALAAAWIPLAWLMSMGQRSRSVGFGLGFGSVEYALNQAEIVTQYLKLVVWPTDLSIDYGVPRPIRVGEVAPQIGFLAAVVGSIGVLAVKRPVLAFPLIVAFLHLAPTSSIIPVPGEVGAERRMYLPLAGLTAVAATVGLMLNLRLGSAASNSSDAMQRIARLATPLIATGLIGCLAILTILRNEQYNNPIELWIGAVRVVPHNYRARINLGSMYFEAGDFENAAEQFRAAVQINDDSIDALSNLGGALLVLGRSNEAVEYLRRAVRGNPDSLDAETSAAWASAANNLAWALATDPAATDDDRREAVRLAQRAVELTDRRDAGALDTLAVALSAAGDFESAVAAARNAVSIAQQRGDDVLAADIAARLALFEQGRRYVEPRP